MEKNFAEMKRDEDEFVLCIDNLKKNNKEDVVKYIKNFYWIMSAYLMSFRMLGTNMIARN
jgi:hypothetical protein